MNARDIIDKLLLSFEKPSNDNKPALDCEELKPLPSLIEFDRKDSPIEPNSGCKVEGYWAISESESRGRGAYPWPKARDASFAGEKEFIKKLTNIENDLRMMKGAHSHFMMTNGTSCCRICKKENGSAEFQYQSYSWPSGYLHYVSSHHVLPSAEFFDFVMKTPEKLQEDKLLLDTTAELNEYLDSLKPMRT